MHNPYRSLGMLTAITAVAMLGLLGSAVPAGASGAPNPAPGANACRSAAVKPTTTAAPCAAAATGGSHSMGTVRTPAGQPAAKPARTAAPRSNLSPFSVTLTATPDNLPVGGATTLTATSNMSVSLPSPYSIMIFDEVAHTQVCDTGSGTTCTTTVAQSVPAIVDYVAYVALFSTTEPPSSVQATSSPVWVSWGLTASLTAVPAAQGPGQTTTLTATTNVFVPFASPWSIVIFDVTAGATSSSCGSGTTCQETISMAGCAAHLYVAYIARNTSPVSDVQATSSGVWVSWLFVSLATSPAEPVPGGTVTLTATSCLDVSPTPYYIRIYDLTGGTMTQLGTGTGSGTTYSATVGPFSPNETHTYVSVLDTFTHNPVVAVSPPVFLTGS